MKQFILISKFPTHVCYPHWHWSHWCSMQKNQLLKVNCLKLKWCICHKLHGNSFMTIIIVNFVQFLCKTAFQAILKENNRIFFYYSTVTPWEDTLWYIPGSADKEVCGTDQERTRRGMHINFLCQQSFYKCLILTWNKQLLSFC